MYIKILIVFITLSVLYIFKTIYNFKFKSSVNKNFGNTCTALISNTLITDSTTITGINYEEQHKCEWDPMILTSYIIWTSVFKFL